LKRTAAAISESLGYGCESDPAVEPPAATGL